MAPVTVVDKKVEAKADPLVWMDSAQLSTSKEKEEKEKN